MPTDFLLTLRRSGSVLGQDFLQNLVEVAFGAGLGGEAGEGGELFHVGLVIAVLVSACCEVSEGGGEWFIRLTSGLDLRLWHMAQRMSTSRADKPAALVALVVMVLFGLLCVCCVGERFELEL